MIQINVNIEVPKGEFCNECIYRTPTINLYSKPKCLIWNKELKYKIFDNWCKCNECKNVIQKLYVEE